MTRSRLDRFYRILAIILCVYGSTAKPAVADGPAAERPTFSGLVQVGDGRSIFLESQGTGSPTVVLISGRGVGAEDWNQILAPNDPAHNAPKDDVSAGLGTFLNSPDAVFPSVARFTLVAAYDRPDVRFDGENLTTPRPQPHSVDLDVSDLHALLTAAKLPPPYVLVAHSYGGLVALLFARKYPDSVAGLVMVDAATEELEGVMGPTKFADWDEQNLGTAGRPGENPKLADAMKQIKAAPAAPKIPTIVLSADKPYRFDLLPPEVHFEQFLFFQDWLKAQELMAAELSARHVKETASGHHIYLYSPELVVAAIRDLVESARAIPQDSEGF